MSAFDEKPTRGVSFRRGSKKEDLASSGAHDQLPIVETGRGAPSRETAAEFVRIDSKISLEATHPFSTLLPHISEARHLESFRRHLEERLDLLAGLADAGSDETSQIRQEELMLRQVVQWLSLGEAG